MKMKSIINSYRDILTGKIEYQLPNKAEKQFKGFFKLEGDPKGENLHFHNIALRGSLLKNTEWYYRHHHKF